VHRNTTVIYTSVQLIYANLKNGIVQGAIAHTCNLSHLEGRNWETPSQLINQPGWDMPVIPAIREALRRRLLI
jgi:hypothetical protein